jgi:ATP-dependent helicase/nuclease subunit B
MASGRKARVALHSSLRIIEASDASQRLAEARAWVAARADGPGVLIVSASRGAADDLARAVALGRGGAIGLHRFSIAQLAARLAAPVLAARGIAPLSYIGGEAVAARATFEASKGDGLSYFGPVARTPGFPRALARTLHELMLARVGAAALSSLPLGGEDLARLLERFEEQFAAASATDRGALFEAAAEAAGTYRDFPLLLLDVPMDSAVEFDFATKLIEAAPDVLVTIPFGDLTTLDRFKTIGLKPTVLEPPGASDLTALKRYVFATRQPPERKALGDVRIFSAPGEGRECVEIARRILHEARAGVPFDQIAVFVRSPRDYVGLLGHAFSRAGIPAWFDRGTGRPHPSGRAFLALLGCAVERLSAARFAEYLSLSQVPDAAPVAAPATPPPADDLFSGFTSVESPPDEPDLEADTLEAPRSSGVASAPNGKSEPAGSVRPKAEGSESSAVVDGTLRAPWKWETLIVESAVIGGDPGRWHRRLAGLAEEYRQKALEEAREDPDSPRLLRLERDARNLEHLRAFALPVIDALAEWPASATWREWLTRFEQLAPRILRKPARVLRVLAELRPMGAIGPVSLEEVRDVLADRLRTIDDHPPAYRYGAVFVGSPHQARGRAFGVVFVPGLAERMFPQKPREDPMLLDKEMREPLDAGLPVQEDRAKTERLLLRLAVGAATDRLWISYPRIDVAGARPRVPSFYALDIVRAITGHIPQHEALQRQALLEGGAKLDWPAPARPADAIDDLEHDLATLRELIDTPDPATVKGHAHYLLRLNEALRRSVTTRWARARSRWMPQDGLVRVSAATKPMLESQRLGARPYSLSALQKFATCPYQFLLSAIYRLEPNDEPEPLQRLDPLTRGALFHEVQAEFFRSMQAQGLLPLESKALPAALRIVERKLADVAASYRERLAPAIDRVWREEIAALGRDLRVWVRRLPQSGSWKPSYFEFSFGLSDEGRDPRSVSDPVTIDGRFRLRGSVDLVELQQGGGQVRVTDHKTGKNRTTPRTVIGGGATLQPVLYGMAIEQILSKPVVSGRLFYCTAAGGFAEHEIPLNDANRRAGLVALEIVDRAIELGFLPPAPAPRACTWCDFRAVCGPDEEKHVARKPVDLLGDLIALREMP